MDFDFVLHILIEFVGKRLESKKAESFKKMLAQFYRLLAAN